MLNAKIRKEDRNRHIAWKQTLSNTTNYEIRLYVCEAAGNQMDHNLIMKEREENDPRSRIKRGANIKSDHVPLVTKMNIWVIRENQKKGEKKLIILTTKKQKEKNRNTENKGKTKQIGKTTQ